MELKIIYKFCLAVIVALVVGFTIDVFYHTETPLSMAAKYSTVISLIAAAAIMDLSLTVFSKIPVINDGLLIGGALTLSYSVYQALFMGAKFRLLILIIALIITLVTGYIRFAKPENTASQQNSKNEPQAIEGT